MEAQAEPKRTVTKRTFEVVFVPVEPESIDYSGLAAALAPGFKRWCEENGGSACDTE